MKKIISETSKKIKKLKVPKKQIELQDIGKNMANQNNSYQSSYKQIDRSFFERDAIIVAQELLGKLIIKKIDQLTLTSKIVETEAYCGPEDKACHAYGNKQSEQKKPFYLNGGHAYIFQLHNNKALNFVTSKPGHPHAVLIRAIQPLQGIETMKKMRKIQIKKLEELANGPGKIGQALGLTKDLNGYDMYQNDSELYVAENPDNQPFKIGVSKRINIDYAEEYIHEPWRFFIRNNSFVSLYTKSNSSLLLKEL